MKESRRGPCVNTAEEIPCLKVAANSKMDQLSQLPAATLEALARNWLLWVAITALLYVFSLYVYFFPTPLTQPFVGSANPNHPLNNRPSV